MQLTTNAPNGMDVDLLNAFRLLDSGVDLNTPTNNEMPDAMFNALAFAHANDIGQFIFSAEWCIAFEESIVDIIGVTHWF